MPDACAFYNTDFNFMLPTMLSIASLRQHLPAGKIDIFVALASDSEEEHRAAEAMAKDFGVNIISVGSKTIDQLSNGVWADKRFPPVTLLKFIMFDILPADVRRVVYVDGDTMFVRNPVELFEIVPHPKTIGVVEDAIAYLSSDISENGRWIRRYLKSIGVGLQDGYLNAGMIVTERDAWQEIGNAAHAFYLQNQSVCKYHDQSALNAVVRGRKSSLSPIWNFQSRFRCWGRVKEIDPIMLHFTGSAKPWLGRLEPWVDMHHRLTELSETFSGAGPPMPAMTAEAIQTHNKDFRGLLHRGRRVLDPRLNLRRRQLLKSHRQSCGGATISGRSGGTRL